MAHEISTVSGKAEVFAVGEMWHGLGAVVQEAQNSEEAARLSGTDWEVMTTDIQGVNGLVIPDRVANYRIAADGSLVNLGVVSKDYKIIQPADCWRGMDAIIGEGNAHYTSAGCLKDGRRVFIQAKLPGEFFIGKSDRVEKYLTLANGNDGGLAFRLYFTATRVVCQNTLTASLRDAASGITLRHIGGDLSERVQEAAEALAAANEYFAAVAFNMQKLAEAKATQKEAEEFIASIYPDWHHMNGNEKVMHSRQGVRDDVMIGYATGPGQEEACGTYWGLYNAVTWYEDHAKWEDSKVAVSRRVESMAFGPGADRKQKAFSVALDMAGI